MKFFFVRVFGGTYECKIRARNSTLYFRRGEDDRILFFLNSESFPICVEVERGVHSYRSARAILQCFVCHAAFQNPEKINKVSSKRVRVCEGNGYARTIRKNLFGG